MEPRFEGRTLSETAFPDDDGSAPPDLTRALSVAASTGDETGLVRVLLSGRLLIPVVATHESSVVTSAAGLRQEKDADLSVVTVRSGEGRLGLPAFTSTAAMAAWSDAARPVPVAGRQVALAAYDEGAEAVLLDLAGPVAYVLAGVAMRALAEGRALLPVAADPAVHAAVLAAAAAAGVPERNVRCDLAPDIDLVVEIWAEPGADPDELTTSAHLMSRALAADPMLRSRLRHGLDLRVVRLDE